jgi:hypothetical protein
MMWVRPTVTRPATSSVFSSADRKGLGIKLPGVVTVQFANIAGFRIAHSDRRVGDGLPIRAAHYSPERAGARIGLRVGKMSRQAQQQDCRPKNFPLRKQFLWHRLALSRLARRSTELFWQSPGTRRINPDECASYLFDGGPPWADQKQMTSGGDYACLLFGRKVT